MSIEAMLRRDAQALVWSMNDAEKQQLRDEIFPAGDASDSSAAGRFGSLQAAGPDSGQGLSEREEAVAVSGGDHTVLDRYREEGVRHAASARRAAELLELIGDDESAGRWWRTAARLGDPDAIDYVDAFLGTPPNHGALAPQRTEGR
ncbi:hypothetical protein [Streptomyces prunicolor]|uniref:Uncharacterized protein n=1 Tax=Streptomyces prunicolor TaxID=67348 RepID=A0ABU4F5A1_9ACTN|nr:hypothetical protein [Streptomyces prunicolor]MDV7215777.1 hypothetical protein [Streptomyces prunicolor]